MSGTQPLHRGSRAHRLLEAGTFFPESALPLDSCPTPRVHHSRPSCQVTSSCAGLPPMALPYSLQLFIVLGCHVICGMASIHYPGPQLPAVAQLWLPIGSAGFAAPSPGSGVLQLHLPSSVSALRLCLRPSSAFWAPSLAPLVLAGVAKCLLHL